MIIHLDGARATVRSATVEAVVIVIWASAWTTRWTVMSRGRHG